MKEIEIYYEGITHKKISPSIHLMSRARSGGVGASSSASLRSKNPERTLVIENNKKKILPPHAAMGGVSPLLLVAPRWPFPCRPSFAVVRGVRVPASIVWWCSLSSLVAVSARNPPCEQLLAVAGAGAGLAPSFPRPRPCCPRVAVPVSSGSLSSSPPCPCCRLVLSS